jgi:serine/threonine protein kinase
MVFSNGTRLGPYELLSQIGAGGMGEVYRARDARLNRDVAVKVLPQSFAADQITPDGKSYAYTFSRFLTELYVIEGLK